MADLHGVRTTPTVVVLLAAGLLVAGCELGGSAGPTPPTAAGGPAGPGSPSPRPPDPAGVVRVAYPEEPGVWHPALTSEPAAVDLAALWGLPLYRVDVAGDLEPALAADSRVLGGDPWAVEVTLRQGRWSDGRAVAAADVVATLQARRAADPRGELTPVVGAEVVGPRRVRLRFDRAYPRWAHLLAGGGGVLPAHVLREGGPPREPDPGLGAYRDGVPVAGGRFRLSEHEPGLSATFEAHPSGPLGPPGLRRIRVLFTPSYETALGLLRDGRVDLVLGHLAVNPVARAARVADVRAEAPLGGTWVGLRWRGGGALGGPEGRAGRVRVRTGLDIRSVVEGLLGGIGEVAEATVPGLAGPWGGAGSPTPRGGLPRLTLLVPRWQEAPGLTARAVRHAIRQAGGDAVLARVEPDVLARVVTERGDGALVVHRDPPWPSLLTLAPPGAGPWLRRRLLAADAGPRRASPAMGRAQAALHADGHELPLYRIGVAHAWSRRLAGIRPSAWPGLAFWQAGDWRLREDPAPVDGPVGWAPVQAARAHLTRW